MEQPSNPAEQARVRQEIEALMSNEETTPTIICDFVQKCDESGFVADEQTEKAFDDLWDRCAELDEAALFFWMLSRGEFTEQ